MRYQHILEAVHWQPWLITSAAHASIAALIESHLAQTYIREGTDFCGRAVELEQMQVIDGVAHIPIAGVLGSKLTSFEKGSGAVDTGDIAREIATAESDPNVHAIFYDFDSPGGMVTGTPELARAIGATQKPSVAFTSSQIASAAYWLASAADQIYATESADIGSIGVYMPWIDSTAAMEKRGLKVELIKAGTLKGTGFPGTALTTAQRAHLQDRVNEIYGIFTSHVTARRPGVTSETMQGQTFLGGESVRRGLIDGLVDDKQGAIEALRALTYSTR